MDFEEKYCLITGANSGLGLAVSKQFAQRGANLILVCRSEEKGEAAVREILEKAPEAKIDMMVCDLSSMRSIHDFIDDLKSSYSRLDILFNNAAVMKQNRTMTEDGFEMMFQVNYLAPFILMNSLLDLLRRGSSPEIINNGRPEDDLRLDFDDLQFSKNYHMYNSFFQTKLCLLLSDLELSRREISDGITVTMADPGPFKSNLVRDVRVAKWFKNLISASVDTAAGNILYVATLDEEAKETGRVFEKREVKTLPAYWKDREVAQRLWSVTEALLADVQSPMSDNIVFEGEKVLTE